MMHQAIPTTFNGTTYRSRLEARWALFFEEIDVHAVYEPWDIGKGYVPDFFLHGLFAENTTNSICIAEIKPITPNSEYVEFLKSVRIPGKSDFFIFVGNPTFYQPNGIHIYGQDKNYVQSGFELTTCEKCGYYGVLLGGWGTMCGCHYNPPNANWLPASEKAKEFRFDLYYEVGDTYKN